MGLIYFSFYVNMSYVSQKWAARVKYMDPVILWCPVSKFNREGYSCHRSTVVREVMQSLFGTFVLRPLDLDSSKVKFSCSICLSPHPGSGIE